MSSGSESDDENELPIPSLNPPLYSSEDASKKFLLIYEEFLRFNRPECFLSSFYEKSKSMASFRKHNNLGRRKHLPNKPVLRHSPIEMLPIVYDTTLYHYADGTISALTPYRYSEDVNKVTEGRNPIHLACEQCQSCNAIFDTKKGAL